MQNPGWIRFIVLTLSQAYLVFAASLAVIALLPGLLTGWHGYVVESGSMTPLITPGDIALSAPVPEGEPLAVGAVIAFENPAEAEPSGVAQVRLHRVVEVADDGDYLTKGDANADIDGAAVSRDQILGQARILVRFAGLPFFWVTHGDVLPFGLWAVPTLAALIVVALGFPRRHLAAAGEVPRSAPRGVLRTPAHQGVLAFAGIAGIGVLIGAIGLPPESATASFTSSTRSTTSWATDASVILTAGRLTPYGIFAGTSIVDGTGSTFVVGSLGTSTGTTITGFTIGEVTGSTDKNNTVAQNAKADALVLSTALSARPTTSHAGALTGTITPGTYRSNGTSWTIATSITLNGGGDSGAIFVFTASSFAIAANASIVLTNGASAKNVYWEITGGPVTLGSGSTMRGTVIAAGGNITAQDGFILIGRLVSTTGTVSTTRGLITLP